MDLVVGDHIGTAEHRDQTYWTTPISVENGSSQVKPYKSVEDLILLGMVIQNPYLTRQKTRFFWVFGLVGKAFGNNTVR